MSKQGGLAGEPCQKVIVYPSKVAGAGVWVHATQDVPFGLKLVCKEISSPSALER